VFEIFTGRARQAIMLAQDEAIGLGDDFVGTEHLLMGLAGVPQGVAGELLAEHGLSASAARAEVARLRASEIGPAGPSEPDIAPVDVLAAIGIDVAAIRERADQAFGPGEFVYPRPAYDEAAKAAIEQSVAQAETLGHDYVGTGHMLLGMLASGDNAAARILGSTGLGEPTGRTLVAARTQAIRE
jgi:ATP-dependent Clp protease ATP-binding subunit ClpA